MGPVHESLECLRNVGVNHTRRQHGVQKGPINNKGTGAMGDFSVMSCHALILKAQQHGLTCWNDESKGIAFESFPIASKVEEFLQRPEQVLLLAAKPGIGKTSCALWLSRFSEHLGHIWLFISLPSIDKPFAPFGLVDHIQKSFGFDDTEMAELQSRRLVLILDSLDEVASQPCAPIAEPAPGLGPVHIQMPSAWEVKQCTLRLTCNPLLGGRVARVYARQQS